LSTSESLRNGRGIWNVRAMPRWHTAAALSPPTSPPRKRTEPALGAYSPAITLNVVLFPEPFRPDQAEDLVLLQPERDVRDRREAAEALRQAADLEHLAAAQ
jgi:hypothetical protein